MVKSSQHLESTGVHVNRKAAGELVEECERPGELNQALMELGATMCTAQVHFS